MREIPVEELVSGDIVILNAGDVIPGNCRIIESKDLFVDEAALTGETYPEDKMSEILPEETPLAQRTNTLFMGTHVVSGSAKAIVVHTGKGTEFGKVSERLALRPSETEVDKELVEKPRRWNISFIRNFMMTFGLLSSVFDYLTFGVLFFILHASPEEFRAGWFLESVISASLVVLVVRTMMPFFKSIPGKYLLTATLLVISVTLVLPFISVGRKLFGFTALPISFLVINGSNRGSIHYLSRSAKKAILQKGEILKSPRNRG